MAGEGGAGQGAAPDAAEGLGRALRRLDMHQRHVSARWRPQSRPDPRRSAAIRPYPLMLRCNMTPELMLLCVRRIAGMSFFAVLNSLATAYINVNKNGDREIRR
ncbi:hypothetical protein K32_36640 [Kaistia sp. 32K]|nr:hypothetical protein K32_36640 [Kaistia sp. 32K]